MEEPDWDDSQIDAATEVERLQIERVALAIENSRRYTPITLDDFRYMEKAVGTTMRHEWDCRMQEAKAAIQAY